MKNLKAEPGMKLLCLFSVLLLFGCHTENENTAESTHTDTVIIKQMQFNPAILTINKGDTVIWLNEDMVDHNITGEKSKGFYSDTLHVGKSWKYPITENADYYCSIHPSMKGKILVK